MKRLNQAKTWLQAKIKALFLLVRSPTQLDNWLYQRNITRRRVKRVIRLLAIAALVGFYSAGLVALGVLSAPSLGVAFPAMVHAAIKSLSDFGAWLSLSNPSEFATILVAEIIAILGSSIIARIFTRGPKSIEPKLEIHPLLTQTLDGGVKSYKLNVSNEMGTTGAIECEAALVVEGIEKRDVLDIDGARFTTANFSETVEAKLIWPNGTTEMTLRSGRNDNVELLRLVPAKDGIEAHFMIPSPDKTWLSTICLRLKTFYIEVGVAPINGKHSKRSYTLGHSFSTGEWELS
jgi:hypothetical protein